MKTEIIIKAITCAITIAALLLLGFATFEDAEPVERFKVVDQYQGCEVIRYTDPTNHWNYLLKCT